MLYFFAATIGRMAKYMDAPLITPGGFSFDFTNRKTQFSDEFFLLVNSGLADIRSFSEFFLIIANRYVSLLLYVSIYQKLIKVFSDKTYIFLYKICTYVCGTEQGSKITFDGHNYSWKRYAFFVSYYFL